MQSVATTLFYLTSHGEKMAAAKVKYVSYGLVNKYSFSVFLNTIFEGEFLILF